MEYLKSLNEQENRYKVSIEPEIELSGVTWNGQEINDIQSHKIEVTYNIEIETREWGIKGISTYGFKGPNEIELYVEWYTDSVDTNTEVSTINLPLDWDKAIHEIDDSDKGTITITEVAIYLKEKIIHSHWTNALVNPVPLEISRIIIKTSTL